MVSLPVLAVLAVLGLWWFTRFSEIFCLSVRNQRVLVVRGRIPPRLLQDIKAVVKTARVERGTIRALKGERGGRLVCSGGIDERTEQRLRNVFGIFPVSQLRHAPVIERPSIGQLLGVAWLAWLFDSSRRA